MAYQILDESQFATSHTGLRTCKDMQLVMQTPPSGHSMDRHQVSPPGPLCNSYDSMHKSGIAEVLCTDLSHNLRHHSRSQTPQSMIKIEGTPNSKAGGFLYMKHGKKAMLRLKPLMQLSAHTVTSRVQIILQQLAQDLSHASAV